MGTPEEERNEAMGRANNGADPEWLEVARVCVLITSWNHDTFTADDVWDKLYATYPHISTHDPRALGPVIAAVARDGWIVNTGAYRKSRLPRRHARPLVVWKDAHR